MTRFTGRLILAGVLAVAACSDSQTAPVPPVAPPPPAGARSAVVSLSTPNTNDGAVIVMLKGPDLSTIRSADTSYFVYSRRSSSGVAHVIVIGNLVPGPLFIVEFNSPQAVSAYTGSIQQVATRGDSILGSLQGYHLSVSAR